MIGLRVGPAVGPRVGMASGIDQDPVRPPIGGGVIPGVTRDAASGIYCPASAAEWTLLMAAAGLATGNPSALHLMQEASGTLADSIGTFPLATSGTGVTFQQNVGGWSRKAWMTTSGGTGLAQNTDVALPNIGTNSLLGLGYVLNTAVAVTRDVIGGGAAATRILGQSFATTGQARAMCNVNTQLSAGNMAGQVRPWAIQINRTASSAALSLDAERVVPAFSAGATGQSLTLGNIVAGASTSLYLYVAWFFNAAAELTLAQMRTLLQTLGWTVAW
jgi:hypothetical protein